VSSNWYPGDESMTDQRGLASRSRHAFLWYYSGAIARIGLSFGTNVLLARLLGPVPFGQMAFVLIVLSIGNLFANAGVSSAIVQKSTLSKAEIRFCFTIQMLFGCGMACLIWTSAPLIAGLFGQSSLVLLLRAISPLFVLQTFGTTSNALLQRAHDARTLQLMYIVSYMIGYLAIGLPMALHGKGVWSLVAAQLVQAGLNSMMLYAKVRHPIIPRIARDSSGLLRFGVKVLAANLCSWGILNLDNAFVGRFAGAFELGLYSRAFSLALTPADAVSTSLQQVLLPSASQIQHDRVKLANVHAALFGLILLVLGPFFAALAAVPDVVILGLYGAKWIGAIPFFQPLALAVPMYATMAITGPLLAARGRPGLELKCQFLTLLVAIPVYDFAVQRSVLTISWAVLGVYVVRCLALTMAVLIESGGSWMVLASVSWPAAALSAVAAGAALISRQFTSSLGFAPRFLAVAATVAVTVLCAFVFLPKMLLSPVANRVPQVVNLLPKRLRFVPDVSRRSN
jgi:PST family polysaccharide transporter